MRTLACLLAACGLALGQPTVAELLERKTLDRVRALAESLDGVLGVAAIDLTTGRTFSYNGDTEFPQASSIKIGILVHMFRSGFRMDEKVTLAPKDAVGGSGRLQARLKHGNVTLTLRELVTAMIEWSDNTATNKCLELAGRERINRTLEELGLTRTRLRRKMMDLEAAVRDEENVSTPLEMARLVETIYRGKAAGADACREMLELLKLPAADMRSVVPDGIDVASKPGQIDGVRAETGIVFLPHRPFALSVAAAYLGGRRSPVIDVTDAVFGHFAKLAESNRYGRKIR